MAPVSALAKMAMGKVVDIPNSSVQQRVQLNPVMMVYFLPNLSEALPHKMAVVHCESEKTAEVIPAYLATSFFLTPKLSIISG
jgi:hypothetical protein